MGDIVKDIAPRIASLASMHQLVQAQLGACMQRLGDNIVKSAQIHTVSFVKFVHLGYCEGCWGDGTIMDVNPQYIISFCYTP